MKNSNVYALLISVGDYEAIGLKNLPTYKGDPVLLGTSLTLGLNVPQDQIRIISGDERPGFVRTATFAWLMTCIAARSSCLFIVVTACTLNTRPGKFSIGWLLTTRWLSRLIICSPSRAATRSWHPAFIIDALASPSHSPPSGTVSVTFRSPWSFMIWPMCSRHCDSYPASSKYTS